MMVRRGLGKFSEMLKVRKKGKNSLKSKSGKKGGKEKPAKEKKK